MRCATTIDPQTTSCIQTDVSCNSVRYAWGNSSLKTWFITKNKKVLLPKSCRLLFTLTVEETDEPIHTADTYPKKGDVISDLDGSKLKINDVSWV
jgi:hypothetical protein